MNQTINSDDGRGLGANRADKPPRGMKTTTNQESPLRAARLQLGLTAYQLALKAGTTEPRIFMLERRRFRPRHDEGRRLAAVLKLPVNDLFPDGIQPEWIQ